MQFLHVMYNVDKCIVIHLYRRRPLPVHVTSMMSKRASVLFWQLDATQRHRDDDGFDISDDSRKVKEKLEPVYGCWSVSGCSSKKRKKGIKCKIVHLVIVQPLPCEDAHAHHEIFRSSRSSGKCRRPAGDSVPGSRCACYVVRGYL